MACVFVACRCRRGRAMAAVFGCCGAMVVEGGLVGVCRGLMAWVAACARRRFSPPPGLLAQGREEGKKNAGLPLRCLHAASFLCRAVLVPCQPRSLYVSHLRLACAKANPAKRAWEVFNLKYAVVWVGCFGSIVAFQLYEEFDEVFNPLFLAFSSFFSCVFRAFFIFFLLFGTKNIFSRIRGGVEYAKVPLGLLVRRCHPPQHHRQRYQRDIQKSPEMVQVPGVRIDSTEHPKAAHAGNTRQYTLTRHHHPYP